MNANVLKRFFDWNREVIESAETPFAKLAVFILPIIAPLVPASMTGLNMFKLLTEMFTFTNAWWVALAMAITISIVLELLGYVGAITFIKSLFQLVKKKTDEYWLPVGLNGAAYIFYIAAMFEINVKLGEYFHMAPIINVIFGILSFVTIPTGLLAANHLNQRAEEELDDKDKKDAQEFKLKKLAIKKGMNIFGGGQSIDERPKKERRKMSKSAARFKIKMIEALNDTYERENRIMKGVELSDRFNLDYHSSKGYISGLRSQWKREHPQAKE